MITFLREISFVKSNLSSLIEVLFNLNGIYFKKNPFFSDALEIFWNICFGGTAMFILIIAQ